ncbi:hypothetical protein BDV95DRAFT_89616 [Massariosphaeria phaeospora]|uniref:Uncharacterized protein n=1 Tax=Massariosphaeria phaeospora TaxID=100035 RepID=A0A7C8MLI3_9PLEO|nr:hypothetical protein BDV95DRAFT_89616 [Massariosphaeria phaeospora]
MHIFIALPTSTHNDSITTTPPYHDQPAMLSPNTAKLGHSIWDGLSRKVFERDLDALSSTNHVPVSQTLQSNEWPTDRGQEIFPFEVEKQLCDDIAFIAAYDYGVEYVSAVTVEPGESGGIVVRLAANQGVSTRVIDALQEVFSLLKTCARKEISLGPCAEQIFDIVVKLNRNKVLGRLASSHFRPRKHIKGPPREPLPARLSRLMVPFTKKSTSENENFLHQLDALHAAFLAVEATSGSLPALKSAVKCVFHLTDNGFSLPKILAETGLPPANIHSRDISEINKIANYWRICTDLAHLSRSYRARFSTCRLQPIEHYAPSGNKLKRYVHAEIQILIFYEINKSQSLWPRAIGASKEACFLCNSLIRTHGSFHLSKAHRRVFPQWTVPDLDFYNAITLETLRKALVGVHKDVRTELKRARNSSSFLHPLQSSVNLWRTCLPTPSLTTVDSVDTVKGGVVTDAGQLRIEGQKEGDFTQQESRGFPESSRSRFNSTNTVTPDFPQSRAISSLLQAANTEAPLTATPSPYQYTRLDWLGVYVHPDTSLHDDRSALRTDISLKSGRRARALEADVSHLFEIENLIPGEDVIISRPMRSSRSDIRAEEMDIMLTDRGSNPIVMSCRWY